tara:strand:- start:136 stop:663 length:528 start_codon:yes stop_codon:yes gene_type:complete
MEILFISPSEMVESTILGGNVGVDKTLPFILETQMQTIESLLGSELYDKMIIDYGNDVLNGVFTPNNVTGNYLTLLNDYIKPITKYESVASYITVSPYTLGNSGIFKRTADNKETVDYVEVERLSQKYSSIAQMYVGRFEKWILKNPLSEYKTIQDEVNASKNLNLNPTWYFGNK